MLASKALPRATRVFAKLPLTHQGTQCVPCILGKASRSPILKTAEHKTHSPKEPLDMVATFTTGPISTPDTQGNQYFQILVDAAIGLMRGQPAPEACPP